MSGGTVSVMSHSLSSRMPCHGPVTACSCVEVTTYRKHGKLTHATSCHLPLQETAAAGSPTQRDSPARIKVQQAKQRFEQLAAPLVWPHRKHSDDNEAADQQDGMEMDG